jgi:hypothetical protein
MQRGAALGSFWWADQGHEMIQDKEEADHRRPGGTAAAYDRHPP